MASIIRIKRSGSSAAPSGGLAAGELAYSWQSDRLYIGTGTETAGVAANIDVIGGLYYTGLVDASTAGQLTTSESSIPVLSSTGTIDNWLVGNLQLTGSTLSSTDTNGDINITPNGTGSIVLDGQSWPQADGGSDQFLKTDGAGQLSWAAIPSGSFTIDGDAGNDTFITGQTLTFSGGTGINTSITDNTVTINLDDTAVTPGSYGSATQIPTFTVDQQGRLTAAGQVNVATTLGLSDGTASGSLDLLSDTLSIVEGEAINVSYDNSTKTFTVSAEDATASNKGVASFDSTNFTVTSGAVVANDITIGTTSLSNGETTLTLAGLQSLEVDNLTIDGNAITASTGGITLVPAAGQHVSVNSATIQDVADPVNDTDAANKRYVDEVAQGLTTKPQVKAATTSNLTATYANGTAGVGATLTIAPTATLTIDGVSAWSQYDGILVKDQTNAFENGRYYVSTVGDALTDWVLTRCGYCDEASEIPGMYIFVTDGTVNANTGWAGTVDDPDTFTVGTDDIDFYQFSGAGSYTAGEGLTLTGTTFDINLATNGGLEITSDELQLKSSVAGNGLTFNNGVVDVVGTSNRISVTADAVDIASTYVGQSSITTLGTITTGTWNGTAISAIYGGTGLTSYSAGDLIYASATNTLAKLVASTEGKVLQINASGLPVWGDIDGGTY